MVNITIDGQKIQVEEGTSLLEAAESIGIKIPTLCYHKALSPYGACRLCLVEITQNGRKMIQASCQYKAAEGKCVTIPYKGPVGNVVREIKGGLASACTYVGAARIKDLPKCASFVRCTRQENTVFS